MKHDMANHLSSIHRLLAGSQHADAVDYLGEILAQTAPAFARPVTGRPGVDALISDKLAAVG